MRMFRSARLLLLALFVSMMSASSYAGVFISVGFAPPPMPVYEQPPCPEDGLMWVPGNWHYGEMGYYWVPGAWVPAPEPGFLWTPGYWGWSNGLYVFHEGYWGRHVGYYGGVNYGYGYGGIGFAGGEWRGGHFAYNTAVVRVNTTVIRNVYVDRTIVERNTIVNNNHVAYSGGPGGIRHEPTNEERMAEHETHQQASPIQQQHIQTAQHNPGSWSKNNGGHPSSLTVERPPSPSHPMPESGNRSMPTEGAPHGGKSASDDWSQKTAAPPSHTNPRPERVPEPEHNPTAGQSHNPPPSHPKPESAPRTPPKPKEPKEK